MPRRGIAAASFVSWETFSSIVIFETRSAARAARSSLPPAAAAGAAASGRALNVWK